MAEKITDETLFEIEEDLRYQKDYEQATLYSGELAEIIAELRELRAVVKDIPLTADGVHITFGMTVWYFDEEAPTIPDVPDTICTGNYVETKVTAIFKKHFNEYSGEVTIGVSSDWEGGNGDVWSSREAALAASEAAKEKR